MGICFFRVISCQVDQCFPPHHLRFWCNLAELILAPNRQEKNISTILVIHSSYKNFIFCLRTIEKATNISQDEFEKFLLILYLPFRDDIGTSTILLSWDFKSGNNFHLYRQKFRILILHNNEKLEGSLCYTMMTCMYLLYIRLIINAISHKSIVMGTKQLVN